MRQDLDDWRFLSRFSKSKFGHNINLSGLREQVDKAGNPFYHHQMYKKITGSLAIHHWTPPY